MIKKPTVNKKSKAQGLVEFALILTLLLTLLYGILETGRLLFIYASTVTAARQATRYGSATGNNPAGTAYYKDCAGIRAAAKRVGFLSPFADANIVITYDNGPGTANLPWTCLPGAAFAFSSGNGIAATGNRVKVCISTTWSPIVGALVPLRWGGTANCSGTVANNTITKQSERTLLSSVAIGVTALPGTYPGSGGITLDISALPTTYDHVGQVITFAYTITNSGSSDLAGTFTIVSDNVFATCPAGYIISPGFSLTCYGYYTITQADLDTGSVVNKATAYTSGASSNEETETVLAIQIKKLRLAISASHTTASIGAIITYTYTVTNSGNITLSSPVYTVTDDKLGSVTCPSPATLAPGGVITCTPKTYTITTADVNAGIFVNTATLNYPLMTPPTPTTQTATATVHTSKLILTVFPSAANANIAGQVITYSYRIYNNSGDEATAPDIIITNTNPIFDVSCTGPIPNGSSITCAPVPTTPATYTVTQADIDAGIPLTHTATAEAKNGATPITSKAVDVSVPIVQTDGLALTISSTTNPASSGFPVVDDTGDTFTVNYMLTNTGNTALTGPYTISPSTIRNGGTPLTITCGTGELAPAYINSSGVLIPGASTSANFCSSTAISVTTNDLNGTYGAYITNLATANATTKVGARNVSSPQQTGIVATYNGARLALAITANPDNAPSTGTLITFTYTLTSTGNVPVILPSPYSIAWTITIGAGLPVTQPGFVCASPVTTIPVNTSTTCTGPSSYTTTAGTDNIINNATAPATNAPPATAQVIVTRAFNCNITHSGPVPTTNPTNPDKDKTTWYIYNKTSAAVHINSITVIWATLDTSLMSVNLSGSVVWSGKTGASGFTITSTTPSSSAKPTWPLTVAAGSQPMVLAFSGNTTGIRVILGFSEASCSAGLDSGNPAQQGTWP